MQIKIKNIHVRYEDKQTVPSVRAAAENDAIIFMLCVAPFCCWRHTGESVRDICRRELEAQVFGRI